MNEANRAIIRNSKYSALLPYIVAQAKHETGNFQSGVYNNNLNMFGMLMPRKRPTLATPGTPSRETPGAFWAKFKTDGDSIRDLFLWMDYTKFPLLVSDADEYANELKQRSYYGDTVTNYSNALKAWISKDEG